MCNNSFEDHLPIHFETELRIKDYIYICKVYNEDIYLGSSQIKLIKPC